MTTEIKYNDSVIATPEAGQTATLKCKGMVMDSDVVVNVDELILQEKTVTENGVVLPDDLYDGLSKVTVSVESSGGLPIEVSTESEMNAFLESAEVGSVYKFTGTSETYENGALYVVEESE